jgi:hypothetical protein
VLSPEAQRGSLADVYGAASTPMRALDLVRPCVLLRTVSVAAPNGDDGHSVGPGRTAQDRLVETEANRLHEAHHLR